MDNTEQQDEKVTFEQELPEVKVMKLEDEAVLLQCKTY